MNIAAYCRVSTEKEDQLNSLDAQKAFFEEFAQKNNYNLVSIYADEGISGTKIKNRLEFQRLLRDAKHGLFDMVVVKDISRFARNTVDLLNSTRQLKAMNIETLFLTANMNTLGNSEFVLTIFGALAQEESANTSKRVKFGKKINAEKGRVPNIVYGYDKTIGDYFNLKINKKEADIVKRIFNLYVNEGHGANKIAILLNKEGLKTKRNCNWSQNAISRIITNPLYTGKIYNCKEEVTDFLTGTRKKKDEEDWLVVDKPELQIIDNNTFEKAAKILEERKSAYNIKRERQSNKHLFSTLIKCSCCGYSFRRMERMYKNSYVRWVCSGRNAMGKDSCPNTTKINEDELKLSIKKYFISLLEKKDNVIKNIVDEFNRIYHTDIDNQNYEKELNTKLSTSKKARQKYMDMYTDDLITRDELKEKVGGLNNEIERLENELKLIKYNLNKGSQLQLILDKTFNDLNSILSMDDMKNVHLKKVIDKIVVDENGKIDVYLKLFNDLGIGNTVLFSDNRT